MLAHPTPSEKRLIGWRAGATARQELHQKGFSWARIDAIFLPASGPKWLPCRPIDEVLLQHLSNENISDRILLAGASAGAWRALAWASADPVQALKTLQDTYIDKHFTKASTPKEISRAYVELVEALLPDASTVRSVLNHPTFDLALHTVRGRGATASTIGWVQKTALVAAALASVATPVLQRRFFERIVFATANADLPFLQGKQIPLDSENIRAATLATGTVPIYMHPVSAPLHAPPGGYLDGGLVDYHLNTHHGRSGKHGLTLQVHFQRRIVPGWFDKFVPWRKPSAQVRDRVLQLYLRDEFHALLPDGRLPARQDFKTFVDRPQERKQRWREAARLGAIAAEQVREDLSTGRLFDVLEPL